MKHFLPRLSAYVLTLTLLSGCALLYADLEPPEVELDGITLGQPSMLGMRVDLEARLRISNPNSVKLPVKGGRLALQINGAEIATARLNEAFDIAPYDATVITVPASLSIAKALSTGFNMLAADDLTVEYALDGHIDLASRLLGRAPINKSGKIVIGGAQK